VIRNNFICELDITISNKILKDVIDTDQLVNGMFKHQRLVENNKHLANIRNQYSFLSPVYNLYKFEPEQIVPIHIDAGRFCAINIPICNTENSDTIFYEKNENAELEYDEKRILHYVKSPVKESFRFTLTRPTLIDTSFPHSVVNYGKETRIILSWSISKPLTFEEVSNKVIGFSI